MFTKTDFALEYAYRKKQYRKLMWIFVAIWVALRITRAIIYLTVGITWLASVPAMFIFWASGVVCGMFMLTYYFYRRSVRIDDIERERSNVANLKKKR
jgi:hypothetical protein